MFSMTIVLALAVSLVISVLFLASRYKRCPSNKILVVFGRAGEGSKSARCYHGGGAFVWPVFQDYAYLSLSPMKLPIILKNALTSQGVQVNIGSNFTIAIENESSGMQLASERLLGLNSEQIGSMAAEIIIGQLRSAVGTMTVNEIISGREKFLSAVNTEVAQELKKVGIHLINANIESIADEKGYIEALGKAETARVVNEAMIQVAEQERVGAEGVSSAERQKTVTVANNEAESVNGRKEAEAKTRIFVQKREAEAAQGENDSAAAIAESVSKKKIRETEAERLAQTARASAEKSVAEAQIESEKAKLRASEVVREQIDKEKEEVMAHKAASVKKIAADAEVYQIQALAQANRNRVEAEAEGEATAIRVRKEAEAEGDRAILMAKAEGMSAFVQACGDDPQAAAQMMLIERMPELTEKLASAISGIKIDKIAILNGGKEGGGNSLSSITHDMVKSVPTLHLIADTLGIKLPSMLQEPQADTPIGPTEKVVTTSSGSQDA